jgi:hypothetical protein
MESATCNLKSEFRRCQVQYTGRHCTVTVTGGDDSEVVSTNINRCSYWEQKPQRISTPVQLECSDSFLKYTSRLRVWETVTVTVGVQLVGQACQWAAQKLRQGKWCTTTYYY